METLDIRGYTVRIEPDTCAENPWEFSDCNPPAIVCAGNCPTCYGVDSWEDLLPAIVPDEVWENLRDEVPSFWDGGDWLRMLCDVLSAAGIPVIVGYRTGYSQGDAAYVLCAATPEWMEATGCPQEHTLSAMECAINEYAAWAWGDVYGVSSITAPDGRDLDVSCWGFYGADHEASGIMDFAISEVAADLDWLAKLADAEKENAACMI